MTKTFIENTKGAGIYQNYAVWSVAGNWTPAGTPVDGDDLAYTAVGSGSDQQADDISNLAPNSVTLSATANATETVYVGGNLAIGTLTLNSVGGKVAMLEATNTFDTSQTVTPRAITINALNGNGTLLSYGTGEAIIDNAATNPTNITFEVAAGGALFVKKPFGASSVLNFLSGGGTIELANPGATISAQITNLVAGDVIEVPGHYVTSAVFSTSGIQRTLAVATDSGTFTFNDIYGSSVYGLASSFDSATGLERLAFSNVDTAISVTTSGAGIANGTGYASAGRQVTFTVNMSMPTLVDPRMGTPYLSLSDGGVATYTNGSDSTALNFVYTVSAGQKSSDLAVTAINPNGGTIVAQPATGLSSTTPNLTAVVSNPVGILQVGPLATHDLNGDHLSDILFRNGDGLAYLWTMNDATVTNGATLSTQVGTNWQIKGLGDFDGNGTADLLWVYNNPSNAADGLNGISYITFQSGSAATSGGVVQQLSSDWQVAGIGDVNGDGMSDIIYRNTTSNLIYIDIMNGATITASSGFASQQVTDPRWQIAGVGDFGGDGKADILWRYDNISNAADPLNGVIYEWSMNGTTVSNAGLISQQPGSDRWTVAGTGDFDGDGNTDILFRYNNPSNPGDPLNGVAYLDMMDGMTVMSGAPTQWQVDNSWSVASIADFSGDGKADILFQHAGDGTAYIWDMNGVAVTTGNLTSAQSGPGWTVQNGVLDG